MSSVPEIASIRLSDVADGVHLLLKVSVAFRCSLGLQQIGQPTINISCFLKKIKLKSLALKAHQICFGGVSI